MKRAILFDALDQVLVSNTKEFIGNEEISQINLTELYDLNTVNVLEVDKELNSWFHFKLEKELSKDLITPGLISENKHKFLRKHYSILDDDKINPRLSKQITEGVIIKDIALVIVRPCDIAQAKFGKNIKLLSGLLLENAVRKANGKLDFGDGLPDSIRCFEHLYFDENSKDVTLLFDYRYVFSVPQNVFVEKFSNLKIFNKELLSEIQVGYSNYSSRLGITQLY